MFHFLKRRHRDDRALIAQDYARIIESARVETLYTDFGVPDTPAARFQMIILHTVPVVRAYALDGRHDNNQYLFDLIFKDIELSFREIGVGDLSVPKKMRAYMKDFNGALHAYLESGDNPVHIVGRNVFGDELAVNPEFAAYIKALLKE